VTPPDYAGPLGAADFALILAQGSDWCGYDVLRVSAAGRCECNFFFAARQVSTFSDPRGRLRPGDTYRTQVWRRAEFRLTTQEQRALRDALEAAAFFSLQDRYDDPRIMDGTQWVIGVRAGQEKRITCSNSFPEPLRQLSRAVREQVMMPHKMELLTASRIKEDRVDPGQERWLEDNGR
jgi:hypothetical protein